MDVVDFCSELIKCKSVTPNDGGAIPFISNFLESLGFETKILNFQSEDGKNSVKNLFARYGKSEKKILGFLGHSDVVPAGDDWNTDPFSAIIKDGWLIGRGAADMKGGLAAACCAVEKYIRSHNNDFSIIILVTGDEEIGSKEGTPSLLKWCAENHQIPNDCLIAEPSSFKDVGDRVYIGHRGSINVRLKYIGKQGHVAYLGNFDNSLSHICKFVTHMLNYKWKHNITAYPKTNVEPTLLFSDNCAENVAPACSEVNLNIRFGSDYTAEDIVKILKNEAKKFKISANFKISGNAYMCDAPQLKSLLSQSITEVTGLTPKFSASGGISDGRYMLDYCNIIEFGLQDELIHQKNEKIKIEDLKILEKIYLNFIEKYFSI